MNRQTTLAKNDEVQQDWHVVDASGLVLGRLAAKLAVILQGKHKPIYTPHHDCGDFIIVLNADKIVLTGDKAEQKFYRTFSGHPSGQRYVRYDRMLEEKPELLLSEAVRRMLPKNKIGRHMLGKLKVYRGTEHPHTAQQPKPLAFQELVASA